LAISLEDVLAAVLGLLAAPLRMISSVMPAILMSIWSAVMPSSVPATLKSMSPR
jgi:NhaP-type Na+/H+ and K+/H+ antiporter